MSSMVRIAYISYFFSKMQKIKFPKNSNPAIRCVSHLLLLKLLNSMRLCDQGKPHICAVAVFVRKSPIDCESNCNKFSRSRRFTLVSIYLPCQLFSSSLHVPHASYQTVTGLTPSYNAPDLQRQFIQKTREYSLLQQLTDHADCFAFTCWRWLA